MVQSASTGASYSVHHTKHIALYFVHWSEISQPILDFSPDHHYTKYWYEHYKSDVIFSGEQQWMQCWYLSSLYYITTVKDVHCILRSTL